MMLTDTVTLARFEPQNSSAEKAQSENTGQMH